MTPAEWDTAARVGLPTVLSIAFLSIAIPVLRTVLRRGLEQIVHGDGNGAPSLSGLDARLDLFGGQQRRDTQAIGDLASGMVAVRQEVAGITAEVAGIREDVRQLGTAWDECRATPGCPQSAPGAEGQ